MARVTPTTLAPFVTLAAAAAVAGLGASGCRGAKAERSAAAHGSGTASPVQAPDTAALARDIPRLLQASDVPGLSIAVVQDGRVTWERGFGTINDSARRPVDSATVFEAASLSKPVFAYLVLRLADRGTLDLDRPLAELVDYPRLAGEARARRITARMVLSHGTGLPNWGGEHLTLLFDPGTAYGYSGEGFAYLQKAVEAVTGRPLDQLARREVFEPLGMTRSSYVWEDRFAGDAAYARDWLWRVGPVNHYVQPNAAYTLLTTAPDYARFVAAVLAGRGLKPATWQSFLSPVRETGPGIAMGLGVRVEQAPDGRIFYHSGNNGRRFTCYMTGDLATHTGFVYFTGAPNGTSLVAALAARVFGPERQARHHGDYDRYDDPHLVAFRSVERAAAEQGADAGRARLRDISARPATRPTFDQTLELGAFFAGRKLAALSLEVLRRSVADAPDSANARLALGRAEEAAGDLPAAIADYRRALTLEGDTAEAREQLQWAEARVAARARPTAVPPRTLERYPGQYEERDVSLRAGRLYYRRGANPPSPLAPMAADLFEVESDPSLRVRFVGEDGGPTSRLIELSSDGSIEESSRTR